jgi:pimeloyl-ACP methyl ester carboxylesterase
MPASWPKAGDGGWRRMRRRPRPRARRSRASSPPRARVVLACGSEDALVRIDELRRLAPDALELAGLGHNLQVEDPDALVRVIEQRLL